MRTFPLLALLAFPTFAGAQAPDIPPVAHPMEHCLKAALQRLPGRIRAMEMEVKSGRTVYEFEVIAAADGHEWDVECSADTGDVTGIERDVKPDDPAFAGVATLGLLQALTIAVDRVDGRMREVEYEVSPEGLAWYEFSLRQQDGREVEVMVDAATGEVIGVDDDEDERLVYRIGD